MTHAKLVAMFLALFAVAPCAFSQQVTVSPSALNFPPQLISEVASGSSALNVTITNTGIANLIISSVLASGGYKQTNNCSTIPRGQSCTVMVGFNPGTLGSINGAITINDNASSSPQVVSLSGVGIAPVQLTPALANFGTIPVGSSSSPQTVTLKALSTASLSINQISASGNFAQTNNCPSSLHGGQSCTIQVIFHPTVNKSVTGALAVSTAIGTASLAFSVALTGTGPAPWSHRSRSNPPP